MLSFTVGGKTTERVKQPEHVHSVHSNKGWSLISSLHGCHICGIEPKLTYFWIPALTAITNDSNSHTSLRFRKKMTNAYIKEVLKYETLTNTKCNSTKCPSIREGEHVEWISVLPGRVQHCTV